MEGLKAIVTAVCVSMIFYGAAMMLLPEGTMSKSFASFAGIAVIASVVISVSGISPGNFDFAFHPSEQTTEISSELAKTVAENEITAVEQSVKRLIITQLAAAGIEPCEVDIFTDISDTSGISIIGAEVVCPTGTADKARQIVNSLGIAAEVIERDGENGP